MKRNERDEMDSGIDTAKARKALRALLACMLSVVLAVSCLPAVSFAAVDDSEDANAVAHEQPATMGSSMSLLSTVASWKQSNGYTSYTLGSKKVKISGATAIGIDVSKWDKTIDWAKVKKAGITYAIIRCGYGSDTTAHDDQTFITNVQGAQAAGVKIGVYLYSYATKATGSGKSSESEAKHTIRRLKEANLAPHDLDYPVFYDIEDPTQSGFSKAKFANMATTFCKAIEAEGYSVGIYSSQSWWVSKLTNDAFTTNGWVRWVARYVTSARTDTGVDNTDIWQFSSTGKVPGISTNVDMNFDYSGQRSTKPSVSSKGYDSLKVAWHKVPSASGYEVQRKVVDGVSAYEDCKTLTGYAKSSFTDTGLTCGTRYRYRVRMVYMAQDGTVTYSTWTKGASAIPKPAKPKATLKQYSSLKKLKLSWEKVAGATGYEVYRKASGKAAKTKNTKSRSWKKTLSLGKTYTLKVRAYRTVNGVKLYGPYSTAVKVKTVPAKTSVKSAKATGRSKAKLAWAKVFGATGYQVAYRAKGGSWHYVYIKGKSKKFTKLKAARYYMKVRAYKKSGGKRYFGAWSSKKSVKVK